MRLSEAIEQLKYYQSKPYVPTVKKVCNIALETIEALQQENEQFRAQVARMREVLENCVEELKGYREEHGDYSHEIQGDYLYDAIKLVSTNTVQDYRNPADVVALRKARTAINNILYTVDYYIAESEIVPNEMHKRHINEAKEALAEIDKAIGGKEE